MIPNRWLSAITSRRLALRTLPAEREEKILSLGLGLRGCVTGCTTKSSADRSEMGQIDRSRRRRGCAGARDTKSAPPRLTTALS